MNDDGSTEIDVYADGHADDGTGILSQTIILDGVDLVTESASSTFSDQTIINTLLDNGALIVGEPSAEIDTIVAELDEIITS